MGVFFVELCKNLEYYLSRCGGLYYVFGGNVMNSPVIALISACGTILAAFISAIALLKVNRIDNQDRIRRSLWAVEEYLKALGKYIANSNDKNFEEYKACYFLCSLYSDLETRQKIENIDKLIQQGNIEAVPGKVLGFTLQYSRKYKMNKYLPRKKWINNK